jgi:hypothetical protein
VSDSRLRVGRAIAKTEEEVADTLIVQLKPRGHRDVPPLMATDGKGGYREALLARWGRCRNTLDAGAQQVASRHIRIGTTCKSLNTARAIG